MSGIIHGRWPIPLASAFLLQQGSNTAPCAVPCDSCHFGRCPRWRPPALKIHLPSQPLESCMKPISSEHQNWRDSLVAASRPHTEHTALSWACVEARAPCWGAFVIWWQPPQPDQTELPEGRLLLAFQLLCSGTRMWAEVQGQHQLSCHPSITYHLK